VSIGSVSLVTGPTPILIIALGLGSVALSFRWRDGVWKHQLLFGVPITAALVGIVALLVDGLALIPYQFPNSYYLWVGLVLLAVVVSVLGWRRFRNWRRVVSVLSVLLSSIMAFTLINQEYAYYPTVGSLFGVNAQNQIADAALAKARQKAMDTPGRPMPAHGYTVSIPIPGPVSHFHARSAYVWVPPVWLVNDTIKLPVVELLAGVPGNPSDWTRAGFADQTADKYAATHGGVAPILVMPDANGSPNGDTECVNSPRGQAETYLTVDVPAFVRARFDAATRPQSWAIAGLSAGATCSVLLALRHPNLYVAFGDYSGLTSPTVGESVDRVATTKILFGGSTAAYDAHDPLSLLRAHTYPTLGGWFEVGTSDPGPLDGQRLLVPLARSADIQTCSKEIPGGGHSFEVWSQSFVDSLPWLASRLGLVAGAARCDDS
jgi:S-formylglutathione hydrolase FrmB